MRHQRNAATPWLALGEKWRLRGYGGGGAGHWRFNSAYDCYRPAASGVAR